MNLFLRWRWALAGACALLSACGTVTPPATAAAAGPLACDDSLKAAYHPDARTKVIAVRAIAKGTQLVAVDSPQPITAARDLCLVKLLVGPGVSAEKDRSARSYSVGIGIEVWLPAGWNERIRNYGGGGWVGGGHRYPDKIGSKVPAIVIANMGYATGTHDGGQPWYQDGSFTFLSNGAVNVEGLHTMAEEAIWQQALQTRALVQAYYGKPPAYSYYDGHSQGGRQGLKVAQEHPEFYDGYLIGQPAVSVTKFGLASFYPQVVMKMELGIDALDRPAAAAFAKKVAAANARAVAACDTAHLGFLLEPFACGYDPVRDAGALCTGVAGDGVTGTSADAATCMNAKEAVALGKIWYGPTIDGSYDQHAGIEVRSGRVLAPKQLWWGFPRGSNLTGQITSARTDMLALALGDIRYAADASATSDIPWTNASTPVRNKWREIDYAAYARAFAQLDARPELREYATENADLRRLAGRRKMILWSGLAEDTIPPQGSVHYYERVRAALRGDVDGFLRMFDIPGMAHSSQGRASTVGGRNDAVPMPALPGNANQDPTRAQDPLFSALVDWVELGVAPRPIVVRSRDGTVAYPLCAYPANITWSGREPLSDPANYSCR
jgi:hypothetical protein